MTQGIYVGRGRPTSKKMVKEAVEKDPSKVIVEATSIFGNEYDGRLSEMPITRSVTFVGPDPYTSRKFYGTIKWDAKKSCWKVS